MIRFEEIIFGHCAHQSGDVSKVFCTYGVAPIGAISVKPINTTGEMEYDVKYSIP
ncbi:MAG: hypothetical protein WBC82_06420 [Dehalococcoidia bacterium]